jgi:hypothetical protein
VPTTSIEERLGCWFPAQYRESLAGIFRQILVETEGDLRIFFLCGFSNILNRCSIWLSGSTKSQKDVCKAPGDPVEEFRRQIRDMIKRNRCYWDDLVQHGLQPAELIDQCSIRGEDARQLTLPDAALDLVVTSPPYAICYEYKEIHQLTQLWFEHYSILSPADSGEVWIGSKGVSHRTLSEASSSCNTGSTLADAALAELSLLAAGNIARRVKREVRALHYYFQDMHAALQEMARVIVPGKRLVLIIGDSYRRGITIPTSAALREMALGSGFALERRIVRNIPGRVLLSTRDKKTGRFSSTGQSDVHLSSAHEVRIETTCRILALQWEHSIAQL